MGLGAILRRLRTITLGPVIFHVRGNPPGSTDELIDLLDRFVDEKLKHPMEWDDFISWDNGNQHVRAARAAIGAFEPLLFSSRLDDRADYAEAVVRERNMLAALLGRPARQAPAQIAYSDQDAG